MSLRNTERFLVKLFVCVRDGAGGGEEIARLALLHKRTHTHTHTHTH